MRKTIRLTQAGFDEKEKELADLQKIRIEAVADLQRAREMGDLSENAAYRAARSKLSRTDSRIRFLNKVMRDVIVVAKRTDGRIGIGSAVILDMDGERKEITVVDAYESDFMRGKISGFSPIGKALLGKKVGEKVQVMTPSGRVEYMVLSVD